MPHVIAAAALATGFYAGYRLAALLANSQRKPAGSNMRKAPREPRDMGPLKFDPANGVYRPRTARD